MGDMAPLVRKYEAEIPAVAQAADFSGVIRAEYAGTVTSVKYTAVAAITGAATHNRTINVRNRGQSGTGTTVVATLNFGNAVNAVAFDEKTITLSSTAADLVVAEGDILEVESLHVGNGIADPGGTVIVEITRS